MSTEKGESVDREVVAATGDNISSGSVADINNMTKRAAAKELIGRYFTQLTEGCGSSECDNEFCKSSSLFSQKGLPKDQAAVKAMHLTRDYGTTKLCDDKSCKKAKGGDEAREATDSFPVGANRTPDKTDTPSTSFGATAGNSKDQESSASLGVNVKCPYLTETKVMSIINHCRSEEKWSLLIRTIGQVFNNSESLVASFRKPLKLSKEELRSMEVDQDKDQDDQDQDETENEPQSTTVPSSSHHNKHNTNDKNTVGDDEVTVDLESAQRAFKELFEIPDQPFLAALINAIVTLSYNVEMELKYHQPYERDPNYLNLFLIIFEIPCLHSPEFVDKAFPQFCKVLGQLPINAQAKLARLWSKYSTEKLQSYLEMLQQLVTVSVISEEWGNGHIVNDSDGITGATRVMKIMYYACLLGGQIDPAHILQREKELKETVDESMQEFFQGEPKEKSPPREDELGKALSVNPIDCRQPLIPFDDFINEPLNEQIEMDKDYPNYYKSDTGKFSFMNHQFILTPATKSLGLFFDNRIRMLNERRTSIFQSLVRGAPSTPYLRLRIRRDHVIDDALVGLEMAAMDNPQDLKKQLYVEFDGEQGIDEGGVSKEFFQMVVEEIFNPDFGMFTYNDETRSFWFNPTSFEAESQFTLIGIVLGLAIYNNVILDVHFPMVVYRKLMGKLGTFEDLHQSHPTLAKNLQYLLDYEGDVEDTFMYNFRISYTDVFGTTINHELKENGESIQVTYENRKEFIDLYADFLLNRSVEKQFRAFKRGFQMVTDESPLHILFRPEEIELLVCGSKHLDFFALEEATEYDGGFSVDSTTVRHFWEVVHALTEEQKRQLLQFTTGSDRVPVGGLSKLKLVIARNGPDSDRLPTAHTCFNVLLLPDYKSKDKLEERLLKAITHAKGFGML